MSWRDIEGKRIEQVRQVDEALVVLQLEGGMLARITAHPPKTPETEARLDLETRKAER